VNNVLRQRTVWAAGLGVSTLLAVAVALEHYLVLAVPAALAIIWFAFVRLDWLMLTVVALTPLSLTLQDRGFNVGLSLPTEPLLFGITLLLFFRLIMTGRVNREVARHPVSMAIFFYLGWMLLTSITSSMPLVSIKHWVARVWFVVPYFFLMVHILATKSYRPLFFWLYLLPLAVAVAYTLSVHAQYGFSKQTSTWVMYPFYKEHTVYGAALAMYIPVATYFALRSQSLLMRMGTLCLLTLVLVGLVYSYTRAAWLSLVVALGIFIIHRLRIRWHLVLLLGLMGLGGLYAVKDQLQRSAERNKAVSSDRLGEHVASMSNISTDASNLERLNRWNSALRMFQERPWTGWGPGTYQFQYAPFQHSSDLTIISTNAGDNGNAHSEYIGPLAEEGVFGLVAIVILLGTLLWTGANLLPALRFHGGRDYWLAISAALGLVTYFTHGVLNNFLDTDKASAPVWGFAALLVALDLQRRKEEG
jgi:O-antigen ligase